APWPVQNGPASSRWRVSDLSPGIRFATLIGHLGCTLGEAGSFMKSSGAIPLPSRTGAALLAFPTWEPNSAEPIRAELYGVEAIEARARELAQACRTTTAGRAQGQLLQRLGRNGRAVAAAHQRITEAAAGVEALSPDAEWLLDNFYIIEEVL